jgi:hypothetical protein
MDASSTEKPKRSWAKSVGVAFLIYLVSFGVFVILDDAGVLPRPCPVLQYIYYPLIWAYMKVLFPH